MESNINAYIIAYLEVRLNQASANVVLVIYKKKATGVFYIFVHFDIITELMLHTRNKLFTDSEISINHVQTAFPNSLSIIPSKCAWNKAVVMDHCSN